MHKEYASALPHFAILLFTNSSTFWVQGYFVTSNFLTGYHATHSFIT